MGSTQYTLDLVTFSSALLQQLVLGQVERNLGKPKQFFRFVEQSGERNPRPEQAAVLTLSLGFFLIEAVFSRFLKIVFRPTTRFCSSVYSSAKCWPWHLRRYSPSFLPHRDSKR
jgi:hypothetical protein